MVTTALLEQLQATLGTGYAIERELAGGGMSRVFVAQERALGRRVVVKILPPELAADVSMERFHREIQLAAGLLHPHIIPLLSAGDADGLPYYTMPFIVGESLRLRLAREGRLGLEDAVRLTREVATALDYAHRQGIVHRDIKPENLLLHDGHALVTDFGIARAVTQSTGAATLTHIGVTLGTPAYMSPEQGAGESNTDGRADVYSLGCVLYEILTGAPPYQAASAAALIAKHFTAPIPHLRERRREVPIAMDEAMGRALAKEPAGRFVSASEFSATLDAALLTPPGASENDRRSPSIAVLPFANLSGADDEYLSDGITEEILNALSRLDGVRVAARTR